MISSRITRRSRYSLFYTELCLVSQLQYIKVLSELMWESYLGLVNSCVEY